MQDMRGMDGWMDGLTVTDRFANVFVWLEIQGGGGGWDEFLYIVMKHPKGSDNTALGV